MEVVGNIHSIETCGTVDGPGIRFVIFMQGCPMRCLYCHNPDTWSTDNNKQISVSEIINQYESVKEFCKGGITVTGGEPLMQTEFVTNLFKEAVIRGIHTALDTSGILFSKMSIEKYSKLLEYTNLVLLDIKHIDNDEHIKLTGHSNLPVLEFAKYLSDIKKPVWIRHVVVPGINDRKDYLIKLGKFIGSLNNVNALDILPYHNMAIPKYDELGIMYKLRDTLPLTKEEAIKARDVIIKAYKSVKSKI